MPTPSGRSRAERYPLPRTHLASVPICILGWLHHYKLGFGAVSSPDPLHLVIISYDLCAEHGSRWSA